MFVPETLLIFENLVLALVPATDTFHMLQACMQECCFKYIDNIQKHLKKTFQAV